MLGILPLTLSYLNVIEVTSLLVDRCFTEHIINLIISESITHRRQ